jgi:sensor c-di-GMP phosphodiesterase-like protein
MEKPTRPDAFADLKALAEGKAPQHACDVEAKARIRFTVAQALAQGRMTFHYQPVVRASNPRFPAFFEMLARLTLPSGQILPTGALMPMSREARSAAP